MLFRKKITRDCSYCSFGTCLDNGKILCAKKGLRSSEESCRRFCYDPFKRTPLKAKVIDFEKYEEQDYSL